MTQAAEHLRRQGVGVQVADTSSQVLHDLPRRSRSTEPRYGARRSIVALSALSILTGCGGSSTQAISVNSVTACLKDAGAIQTATQPNPQPYGGDAVSARLPGPKVVGVLVLNDSGAAKATGSAYALQHTGQSAFVTDDGKNVIVTPKDPDSSTLATLRRCTTP